ncbi:MAG TPA: O-antigen ligase family protein [Candidatus Binataceae bacterium]|nr:O-antigen ligase family protein [Candidatus Binataceae bacterium]
MRLEAALAVAVCAVAFGGCFTAMRRAVWAGVVAMLAVGYLYGIVRANIDSPLAQFVYDAALAGFFIAALARPLGVGQRLRMRPLMPWMLCLMGWPTLLLLVPAQHPLIQLVGWRGNVLFVPFILIGGMIEDADVRMIARGVAMMNLAVLALALAETVIGVPSFYPQNALDAIIYNSTDVFFNGARHFRIPASFANSAAYATNMVASMPLLLGGLNVEAARSWNRRLLLAAIAASAIGVFLAASRAEAAMLILMVLIISFSPRRDQFPRLAWLALVVLIAILVALTPRLQRFLTLGEPGMVAARLQRSVNESFIELVEEYPLGNGLGGGGTSIPHFLQPLVKDPIGLENEYARIVAEQGLPGLALWLGFFGWVLMRAAPHRRDPWAAGRRLAWLFCAISFAAAVVGTGLLNAIPQTATLLMFAGWTAAAGTAASPRRRVPQSENYMIDPRARRA